MLMKWTYAIICYSNNSTLNNTILIYSFSGGVNHLILLQPLFRLHLLLMEVAILIDWVGKDKLVLQHLLILYLLYQHQPSYHRLHPLVCPLIIQQLHSHLQPHPLQ